MGHVDGGPLTEMSLQKEERNKLTRTSLLEQSDALRALQGTGELEPENNRTLFKKTIADPNSTELDHVEYLRLK